MWMLYEHKQNMDVIRQQTESRCYSECSPCSHPCCVRMFQLFRQLSTHILTGSKSLLLFSWIIKLRKGIMNGKSHKTTWLTNILACYENKQAVGTCTCQKHSFTIIMWSQVRHDFNNKNIRQL